MSDATTETLDPEKNEPKPVEQAPMSTFQAAATVIRDWETALKKSNKLRMVADKEWAARLLDSYKNESLQKDLKNDAARKAYADLMTADLFHVSADAEAEAKVLEALVNVLIARRAQ